MILYPVFCSVEICSFEIFLDGQHSLMDQQCRRIPDKVFS